MITAAYVNPSPISLLQLIILAVIQGLAELLPISSSAHVVVAEKLMGLDPSAPRMTLLLVMLHTGTMFAVMVYFWRQWRESYFHSKQTFKRFAWLATVATALTGIIGVSLIRIIERTAFRDMPHADIEQLFNRLDLVAPALAAAGILILLAGFFEHRRGSQTAAGRTNLSATQAALIGAVQAFCLPFRGFSRSGATISTGILVGVTKSCAETFSFVLALILTPPVLIREALRLIQAQRADTAVTVASAVFPCLLGAVFAFIAGVLALKWLSRWLERGRWYFFGIYCLIAATFVTLLHHAGY